jgi:hypothetical protein
MSEHAQCAAVLQDGSRCRSVAVNDAEFCEHHHAIAGEHGAEAVRHGDHLPVRRKRVVQAPVVAEVSEAVVGNGANMIDPSAVRPRLAEVAAERIDDLQRVLLETATGANKNMWVTVSCKHCARSGRYEIVVPDNKVRLDAIQALLHEALGRPAQAEEPHVSRVPDSVEAIEKMSWHDMEELFAAIFVDEIASLQDRGGEQLVRERLAGLPPAQRNILRRELANVG